MREGSIKKGEVDCSFKASNFKKKNNGNFLGNLRYFIGICVKNK